MNALSRFILHLLDWWHQNKDTPVSLRSALMMALVLAAIGVVIGRWHPEEDYRVLRDKMISLREDVRQLAASREKGEREMRRLHLAAERGKKSEEKFRARIEELTIEEMRRREEAIFYRRVLGAETQPALNVYALEETPDFRPGHHRFSAVLVYPQTAFKGGYYFEAVAITGNGEQIFRVPPEDLAPLDFDKYEEIEQTVSLPADAQISKLRVVIQNEEGEIETDAELEVTATES